MRGENVTGTNGIVPAPNGAPGSTKRKAPATKRAVNGPARRAAETLTEAPVLMEIAPVDAPMWPIHAVGWLQPDIGPSAPAWSGLVNARHHGIPAPGFLSPGIEPLNRPAERNADCPVPARTGRPKMPQSDLAPLGWDPRAVAKGGR